MSVSRSSSDGNVSGETSQEGSPTRRSLSPKGSPARSREGSPDRRVEDKYFQAARMGKVKVVKEGLEGGVVTVDSFDSKGDTLMHVAAGQGHRNVVKELFRRGADPDCRNVAGVRLEKLGPSKWKGEPTLALDEEALGEEMVRREKAAAVDFEMLLSAVDDAAKPGAANTHSDLVENVSELRTRLGDRARAEKLMEVVGKVWARGPLFDVDQGKMGEEVDLLVEKTGGRDVETLLDDLAAKEKMVEDVAKDKAAEKESAKVLVEMAALLAEVREELVGAKEGERKALQQAKAVSDLIQVRLDDLIPAST
ncbi:hypothetical protein T484DRAFT_1773162 [Baffinella frigidus]|nr:hypothetical protein T484DRAFT_1773162 [Cryptophyta sp. CCMP2293]